MPPQARSLEGWASSCVFCAGTTGNRCLNSTVQYRRGTGPVCIQRMIRSQVTRQVCDFFCIQARPGRVSWRSSYFIRILLIRCSTSDLPCQNCVCVEPFKPILPALAAWASISIPNTLSSIRSLTPSATTPHRSASTDHPQIAFEYYWFRKQTTTRSYIYCASNRTTFQGSIAGLRHVESRLLQRTTARRLPPSAGWLWTSTTSAGMYSLN